MNHITLIRSLIFAACMAILPLAGCGGGDHQNPNSEIARLQKETKDLQTRIEKLQTDNGDLKHREGYFVMSIWLAVLTAFVLLCVGLACGIKIKKSILLHETKQE